MKTRRFCMIIGIAGCLLATSSDFAATLVIPPGGAQANILGCVFINSTGLMFSNCTTANEFTAGGPDTGSYSTLTGGTIDNLSPPAPGILGTPIVDFISFTVTGGPIDFNLNQIEPGIGNTANCTSNAIGSACTPAGSALTLTQTATGVSVSLSVEGIAYFGASTTGSNPTNITFSVPNTIPGTVTGVLADIESTTGITDSFSATVASIGAVPEPGTLMMACLGLGMLTTGFIRRRLLRK
jgi:hypothetical protein